MNRLIGIAGAMLLCLLLVVPVAAAADPGDRIEHLVITSGADITLPADQTVDVFVVVDGHARIAGHARAIFVLDGTADLVGAHASGVVAIRGRVNIDAASVVTGDIRTFDAVIATAPGATFGGRIRDLGPDIALGWLGIGSILLFIYLAFAISAIAAGVVVAGVAGRQVRAATSLISHEPIQVIGAAFLGLVGLLTAGVLAVVTLVGIPFGLGVLGLVLPALFVAGYIVAGIWLGQVVLARTSPGVTRERPYLAALIGLTIVGLVGILPPVGGLVSFIGFGAVVLLMWRIVRGDHGPVAADRDAGPVAQAAG